LFEGGFEVIDDFLADNLSSREIVGLFQRFILESEDEKFVFLPRLVMLQG